MHKEVDEAIISRGEAYIERAHALTRFRSDTSPYIETIVASTDENPAITVFVAGIMATDGADGYYARKGAALLGISTSEEGAVEDPEADKRLANALMRGLVARYIRQKDYVSAGIMALNVGVSHWRDERMVENRTLAAEAHLDPDTLKAIPINKLKTAVQMKASLVAMNSNNRRTRRSALLAFTGGTAIGIVGERQYRRHVHKLLRNCA